MCVSVIDINESYSKLMLVVTNFVNVRFRVKNYESLRYFVVVLDVKIEKTLATASKLH